MKVFFKQRLREEFKVPYRLPKNVVVSDEDIARLKALKWSDIGIEDLGGSGTIAHMGFTVPFQTNAMEGVVVDIQVINNTIYQVHMHMIPQLQGIGLGYKIHKALIADLGHLYSGKGRVLNPLADHLWKKLSTDKDIACHSSNLGSMCVSNNNPQRQKLFQFVDNG